MTGKRVMYICSSRPWILRNALSLLDASLSYGRRAKPYGRMAPALHTQTPATQQTMDGAISKYQ